MSNTKAATRTSQISAKQATQDDFFKKSPLAGFNVEG